MSLPLPLQAGAFLGGQYSIEKLLNSGGFGAVYRGIDTSEGNRPCAIKETYDVTPAARRQALMEASVLFSIKSKHLPTVYDAFEANGRFYLVMQLIEGQNLVEVVKSRSRPCSEQQVLAWLLPIMNILQELHSRVSPVIHRDIKPANIILTNGNDPHAVLVDFGITKLYDPQSNTQTIVRAVSEGFSPIEQYLGKTSPQSDIYSLAASMYFLLTCITPPVALKRTVDDTLIAPRVLNPAISPKMERVLLKALSVNADQRYQSMRNFVQALREPSFNAYADQTISAYPSTYLGHSTSASRSGEVARPFGNYSSAHKVQPVQSIPPPPPQYVQSASYPVRVPTPPPGYVMVHQSALVPAKSLPSPLGQGCLWGLLQGVCAALLILFLKKDAYFYMDIVVGFLFYLLAGFLTTRKGGKSSRGSWAGFWAGIASTSFFWFTLGIGLGIRVSQQIQAENTLAHQHGIVLRQDRVWNSAWQIVLPDFLKHTSTQPQSAQSAGLSLLILVAGGVVCASGFGWIGGLLGKSRYMASMKFKAREQIP
ncbi:MAG: serine/threonine protein kinase [Chloroflexota bacterium]|nr:serine/threonine protein kinase [Chloroflexota bacterium]